MKVTVLLAVFNGGDYLGDAVESVLAQTFEDFELVLVDDASTDGAIDRLPADPRIRIVRNERNLGQVPSLNRGLTEARGEYVARLDADDVMLPPRLDRQAAILDADPTVALVGTWLDVVDEDGRRVATLRGEIGTYAEFVVALLTDRIPFGHPSVMYRRDLVRALGGYDATLAPSEDKDLYRRLALGRNDARVVAEPLVRYRRHAAQLSQQQLERQLANDHAGQERFLAALAPTASARALRLLLTADEEFWNEPPLDDLEPVLEGIADRLHLGPADRKVIADAVADVCAHTLLRGWWSAGSPDAARAAALVDVVKRYRSRESRWAVAMLPLLRATRPVGKAVHVTRAQGRRALRADGLRPLRQRARRSRVLRTIYRRILGFRLLDD